MLRGRMLEEFGPPEELRHDCPEGIGIRPRGIPMHHDNQINPLRHMVSMKAHVLPQASLDPIPRHRAPETARNGQAETSSWAGLALDVDTQASPGHLFTAADDCLEFLRRPNAIRPRKALLHVRPPPPPHTVRRFRPLARRRLSTRRPAAVRIRRRNPWVRFRFTRLG